MAECQAMIQPQAEAARHQRVFPPFDVPHFLCGRPDAHQAGLINLLSNAIKYNKAGGTVKVTCKAWMQRVCALRCKTRADGLSAEQLAQLFQPFNRLGQEAYAEEGTGIGLVVCKRLVELMGGSIGCGKHGGPWQRVLVRAGFAPRAARHCAGGRGGRRPGARRCACDGFSTDLALCRRQPGQL
jgi:signal transduction histidine kinase